MICGMLGGAVDCYFFDLDKTLYDYDFRFRLPELARLTGQSQYRLAKSWWAAGLERRAEAGEWPTSDEYLDAFAEATQSRRLSLEEWAQARSLAMTRIDGSVAALRRASELGTVSLLSNNPAPLADALPLLAPDVAEILAGNLVVSFMVRARKPSPELYERALARYGLTADRAFLADDTQANVAGARAVGWTAHLFEYADGVPQTDALLAAVEAFAAR
jgi:FMN phosphatase YigB (HAD superfamily)